MKMKRNSTRIDIAMKYRSGAGMLLYLVKYSRPDLANAVRELSKGVQSPNEMCWKELMRVIKFTLDTREYGLKFEIGMDEDLEEPREENFDRKMRPSEVLLRSGIHSVFA